MQTQSISQEANQSDLLRNTLRLNALFSLLSGAAFILAPGFIGPFIGLPYPAAFVIAGISLLPFAYGVYRVSGAKPITTNAARTIIVMDVSWVILSALFLWLMWSQLTVAGRWFVAIQADIVALFAVMQVVGVRRL